MTIRSIRFPITPNLESLNGTLGRAEIRNGYAEAISQEEVKVLSRPALTLAQGSFAVFGQGMANTPDGKIFVISGGDIYFSAPTNSASVVSTVAVGGPVLTGYLNGAFYAVQAASPHQVYKSVSPYTAWTTLGTAGLSAALTDLIVHNNELTALSVTGTRIFYSGNGTTWGSYGTGPTEIPRNAYSFGGVLYAMANVDNGDEFFYTSDRGASWGTGTVSCAAGGNYWGGNYFAGVHGGKMWALTTSTGTAGAAYSSDATNWTKTVANVPYTVNVANVFGHLASYRGNMYFQVATAGTGYSPWITNDGVFFAASGTTTSPELISQAQLNSLIGPGGNLYVTANFTSGLALLKLSSTGGLVLVSALSTVNNNNNEMISSVATSAGVIFLKSSTNAYTISSGVVTSVSDADYPAVTVRGAVYLNGRLYVMEPNGTIWNSADDDFTSWASTDFITAEFEADEGVCLAKHGEYVIALGQFTTEAFYDAGNTTGSPLSPVGSAVMLIGCAHADSVAQVEGSLVWVAQQKGQGSTFNKGRFVVVMKGYGSYERISTPDVERILDKDAFNAVYGAILTVSGHVFYVLTLVDSNVTLVYDFRTQLWGDWTLLTAQSAKAVTSITASGLLAEAILASHGYSDGDQVVITGGTGTFTAANGTFNVTAVNAGTFTYPIATTFSGTCTTGTSQGWTSGPLDISASCYFDNEQLVQLRETGDVYALQGTGVTDNGAPIDFRIRTRNWDGGTNREKFQGALDVVGDKVSSTGLVRYSDDDFQTYTKFQRLDLSLRRPRSRRGGSFSRRAVEFRHTLAAKVGIYAIEAEVEIGEQ